MMPNMTMSKYVGRIVIMVTSPTPLLLWLLVSLSLPWDECQDQLADWTWPIAATIFPLSTVTALKTSHRYHSFIHNYNYYYYTTTTTTTVSSWNLANWKTRKETLWQNWKMENLQKFLSSLACICCSSHNSSPFGLLFIKWRQYYDDE